MSETSEHPIAALFQDHMQAELDGNLDQTMATMSDVPHLNHVPVRAGGSGQAAVRDFDARHLVGRFFPPDVEISPISRTTDGEQIVDELLTSSSHTQAIDWMLPQVPPTGRRVEIPLVVIVRAGGGKIAHEHVYWDQASVLVQVGLLDPTGLPVTGADRAELVRNPAGGYRTEY